MSTIQVFSSKPSNNPLTLWRTAQMSSFNKWNSYFAHFVARHWPAVRPLTLTQVDANVCLVVSCLPCWISFYLTSPPAKDNPYFLLISTDNPTPNPRIADWIAAPAPRPCQLCCGLLVACLRVLPKGLKERRGECDGEPCRSLRVIRCVRVSPMRC